MLCRSRAWRYIITRVFALVCVCVCVCGGGGLTHEEGEGQHAPHKAPSSFVSKKVELEGNHMRCPRAVPLPCPLVGCDGHCWAGRAASPPQHGRLRPRPKATCCQHGHDQRDGWGRGGQLRCRRWLTYALRPRHSAQWCAGAAQLGAPPQLPSSYPAGACARAWKFLCVRLHVCMCVYACERVCKCTCVYVYMPVRAHT